MGGFVMDGQQHMGIRPPGKAFSVCLFLYFVPRSSQLSPFPLLLSLASSVLPHIFSLLSSLSFIPSFSFFFALLSHLLTVSLGVSVFHTVSAMFVVCSTSTLLVFSHTQALSGSRAVCAPSNTVIKSTVPHTVHTHCYPPSLDTQTRTGVVNHITQPSPSSLPLPRSQSLSLTPSGLIPEFVLKLLSSSSIPCFLGFSQVSNPISPSTQSQQVWINCQAT